MSPTEDFVRAILSSQQKHQHAVTTSISKDEDVLRHRCPKCGYLNGSKSPVYHRARWRFFGCKTEWEHLCWSCERCGASWTGPTKDSLPAEKP